MSDFFRRITTFSLLLFTGFCFLKAGAGLVSDSSDLSLTEVEAAIPARITPQRLQTTPIQKMRAGMRVLGRNPDRWDTQSVIEPDPVPWRLVSVRMEQQQPGQFVLGQLLRPLSWIRQNDALPGAVIQLEIPEIHVAGDAEVLSIADCPPIRRGPGSVVTGTFQHVSDEVISVFVEGEPEPIGTTSQHPFWSRDRNAFVPAGELRIGEELKTALGTSTRVTSIEIRAGPETVYGLEVAGEHVYQITNAGLPVHNARVGKASRVGDYDPFMVPGPNPNNLRMKIVDPVAGPGKGVGVYIKPHFGKTKVGMVGESKTFRYRYSNKSPEGGGGIEIEISQTRFVKAADDSAYKWTARRQRLFDEEYVDRITPEGAIFRSSTGDTPVKADKWIKYRHIFGYGDVAEDFGR